MPHGPSLLSLSASALYLLTCLACSVALFVARRERQIDWHWRVWLALLVLFALLIAARLFMVEDLIRDGLRDWARATDHYWERRSFQRPLAAGAIALVGLALVAWLLRALRFATGRRNYAALAGLACGGAMVAVVGLRLISLSPVDRLLFGPLKLNWFLDIGSSLGVAGSALFYAWVVTRRP